jgi:hypothetical protein
MKCFFLDTQNLDHYTHEPMSDKTNSHEKLVRGLGLVDATMIVVGSMIGSGIFIVSAESSRLVGAPGWLLMAWALAGVLTITGTLCVLNSSVLCRRCFFQWLRFESFNTTATGCSDDSLSNVYQHARAQVREADSKPIKLITHYSSLSLLFHPLFRNLSLHFHRHGL